MNTHIWSCFFSYSYIFVNHYIILSWDFSTHVYPIFLAFDISDVVTPCWETPCPGDGECLRGEPWRPSSQRCLQNLQALRDPENSRPILVTHCLLWLSRKQRAAFGAELAWSFWMKKILELGWSVGDFFNIVVVCFLLPQFLENHMLVFLQGEKL